MTEEPKVALLDADMFAYRVAAGSEEDSVEFARSRLTEWVTNVVYFDLKCEDYKAWITGKGNFRKDIAVTQPYKGNRKDTVRPKHLDDMRAHLQRLGALVTVDEEADDAVAIESCRGNYWIVHQDKDLDQLTGWHYNPVKKEKYYVTPGEGIKCFYMQMLTGDRTDHIPGLARVGPVKAEKILKDCKSESDLLWATREAYRERNHGDDYFLEQGRLLWLRRFEGQLWTPPT